MISKDSENSSKNTEKRSPGKTYSIFLGGLPPSSKKPQIIESVNRALLKIGIEGEWEVELKGKKGKNGHLGFGFVHFKDQNHQKKALKIFKEAYKISKQKGNLSNEVQDEEFDDGEIVGIYVLGRIIEVKEAWSVEEHKNITDNERRKKVYISCLRKSVRRGKKFKFKF